MRRAAATDRNQAEIVAAYRMVGASVQPLHSVGKGCPDLVVGYRGVNYMIEAKDGMKTPSQRVLTPDQVAWHRDWRGQVVTVKSVREALEAIGVPFRGVVS